MDWEWTTLREAMIEAGAEALRFAAEGFETHTKSDQSPVTTADLTIDRLLRERLTAAFPKDGWLSEETEDGPDRLSKQRVWIVDPIDGTRAYVRGLPEFCISAALVEHGTPALSAVYNPARGEWFSAIRRRGLHVERLGSAREAPFDPGDRPLLLVNPWELRTGRLRALECHMRCQPIGSIAYALALVAAGLADGALMLEGGNEWDLAAGMLLVEESGGLATAPAGHTLVFNQPDPRQTGALAIGRTLRPALSTLLRDVASTPRERSAHH